MVKVKIDTVHGAPLMWFWKKSYFCRNLCQKMCLYWKAINSWLFLSWCNVTVVRVWRWAYTQFFVYLASSYGEIDGLLPLNLKFISEVSSFVRGARCVNNNMLCLKQSYPFRTAAVPRVRTKYGEATYHFSAGKMWKSSENVRQALTLTLFKTRLKTDWRCLIHTLHFFIIFIFRQ